MDSATVTLLAAGIPASVAALTFFGAEVFRARSARSQIIEDAIARLASALQAVPLAEARRFRRPRELGAIYVEVAGAAMYLLTVSRKGDRTVTLWFLAEAGRFTVLHGPEARVEHAAKMMAWLSTWRIEPRQIEKRALNTKQPPADPRGPAGG